MKTFKEYSLRDKLDKYVSDEIKMNTSRWTPLTLQAGAMFHLSFGAIL